MSDKPLPERVAAIEVYTLETRDDVREIKAMLAEQNRQVQANRNDITALKTHSRLFSIFMSSIATVVSAVMNWAR